MAHRLRQFCAICSNPRASPLGLPTRSLARRFAGALPPPPRLRRDLAEAPSARRRAVRVAHSLSLARVAVAVDRPTRAVLLMGAVACSAKPIYTRFSPSLSRVHTLRHLALTRRSHSLFAVHLQRPISRRDRPRPRRRNRAGPTALRAVTGTLESRTRPRLDSEAFVCSVPVCP